MIRMFRCVPFLPILTEGTDQPLSQANWTTAHPTAHSSYSHGINHAPHDEQIPRIHFAKSPRTQKPPSQVLENCWKQSRRKRGYMFIASSLGGRLIARLERAFPA
ncbi:unnamed protein product, partial [Laminaria digitata]